MNSGGKPLRPAILRANAASLPRRRPAPPKSPPLPPLIRAVAETSVPCSCAMIRSIGPPGAN